jgi:hypothetical protein
MEKNMRETNSIGKIISGRKHIRQFAENYSEKCGKSAKWIEKDIIKAKKLNHISLGEYEWIGYDTLTEEQKKTVSTLWTRAEFRKTFTDRRYKCILSNKYIFSKVFGEYYGRRCYLAKDVTEDILKELSGKEGRVIAKPNCKGQGQGIKVFSTVTEEERKTAMEFISKADNYIVEEYITQHSEMAKVNPGAVSIIRFYSVSSPAGNYVFAPVLTAAINKSVANGCQDALTAMVDIRTGEVITDAVDQNEFVEYANHPITGVQFKGFKVPYWQECLELMRKALPLASRISNIGWDVAITEDGPLLIEANTIPGFNTAQYKGYSWVTDGWGYQPLFDEGMNGTPLPNDGRYDRVLIKV